MRRHPTQQRAASPEAGRTTLSFGQVTEVDPQYCRVRAQQSDRDGAITPWLQIPQPGAGDGLAVFALPKQGQFGAFLLDEAGERGIWLGSLWTESTAPPSEPAAIAPAESTTWVKFPDGSVILYDAEAHHMVIELKGGAASHATIRSEGTILIEAVEDITLKAKRVTTITLPTYPGGTSPAITRDEGIEI
jgi:phage baseplate assembly protein gpV